MGSFVSFLIFGPIVILLWLVAIALAVTIWKIIND